MDNLYMYNKYADPPKEALRQFNNGRFSGTDINPMWRIRVLTEEYGECGIGWYCIPKNRWTEKAEYEAVINGKTAKLLDIAVFYEVELYVKRDGKWSMPIYGVGGNSFSEYSKKQDRIITSDEAYKMAYTDALGIACKALGIGANVWWKFPDSKYARSNVEAERSNAEPAAKPQNESAKGTPVNQSTVHPPVCADCGCVIVEHGDRSSQEMAHAAKDKFGRVLCIQCGKDEAARRAAAS